ncbi:MAG: hypothetical protein JNL68_19430 [Burkholderiales bacterium]|nr:hypothetical protein [Burkholderiales bacterium]
MSFLGIRYSLDYVRSPLASEELLHQAALLRLEGCEKVFRNFDVLLHCPERRCNLALYVKWRQPQG